MTSDLNTFTLRYKQLRAKGSPKMQISVAVDCTQEYLAFLLCPCSALLGEGIIGIGYFYTLSPTSCKFPGMNLQKENVEKERYLTLLKATVMKQIRPHYD